MPIIFEARLGNSESDRKLRKIYRAHNMLWILYYTLFFALAGFGTAIFAGIQGNLLLAAFIAALTVGVIALFLKRQLRRTPRRRR